MTPSVGSLTLSMDANLSKIKISDELLATFMNDEARKHLCLNYSIKFYLIGNLSRIEYREDLLKQRQDEERQKKEEKRAEAIELEERLERLRLMVRPSHVQSDPARLRQSTAAWHNRVEPSEEQLEQMVTQQPLFGTNTYSDRQLMADPRLRVEHALREAGLAHTDYARSLISKLQPLQPPRKDLQSNIQFKDSS